MQPSYYLARTLAGLVAAGALAVPSGACGAAVDTPSSLSTQATSIVANTAAQWANHQIADGQLVDRFDGALGGYGTPMIGQAMVETGVTSNNQPLIESGLRAEVSDITHSDDGGFDLLALSDSLKWNRSHLANNPAWLTSQTQLASYLAQRGTVAVSSGAEPCYGDASCYNNLKLVTATASLDLLSTDIAGGVPGALLDNRGGLQTSAMRDLKLAVVNTSSNAWRAGQLLSFTDAGILSDPSRDPLAYHELSTMMLGHDIEILGSATPHSVVAAFLRDARAIVGLMAPDGDVAYIGRGQGQVWNVAAAADALSIAASITPNAAWRGRYLTGVSRVLTRLQTVYGIGAWGLALTPRLADGKGSDYRGIDGYANTLVYNGLALWALQDAAKALAKAAPAAPRSIGSDVNGAFIDPGSTEFVTWKHGNLWYAIHAADTHSDARYDFGLVAAEQRIGGVWQPAMPYRPLTGQPTTGGPELVSGQMIPVGTHLSVGAKGVVKITGGWAKASLERPTVDLGTVWTFRPDGENGTTMSFPTHAQTYRFQVWYEAGSRVMPSSHGLAVVEPNGHHLTYRFNLPVGLSTAGEYHSAYTENLDSTVITVHGHKKGHISYTTEF